MDTIPLSPEWRRALGMLASAGMTEAAMLARGFTAEMLPSLVHSGFATASAETVKIGGRSIEVCRMRISAAGRYFLSNSRECAPEKIHVAPGGGGTCNKGATAIAITPPPPRWCHS